MQPIAATGFALTLMGILFLLGHSVVQIAFGLPPPGLGLALLGGLAAFVTTALGALPAIILRKLPQRMEDVMLGLAAGMMLAATAFSLIVPALNASGALVSHKGLASGVVVFGMSLGVLLMLGMDALLPHEHMVIGAVGPGHERISRIWLFVFAIAVHNLPEGMAIGASFAQADLRVGLPLTTATARPSGIS